MLADTFATRYRECMLATRTSSIPAPISVRVPVRRPVLVVKMPKTAVASPANDGATTLALHLAALRREHDLDGVVVLDADTAGLLASAGEADAALELARFARSVLDLPPSAKAEATRRVSLLVMHVRGSLWVAANAERALHEDEGEDLVTAVRAAMPEEPTAEDDALAESLSRAFGEEDPDDPFVDWLG